MVLTLFMWFLTGNRYRKNRKKLYKKKSKKVNSKEV